MQKNKGAWMDDLQANGGLKSYVLTTFYSIFKNFNKSHERHARTGRCDRLFSYQQQQKRLKKRDKIITLHISDTLIS